MSNKLPKPKKDWTLSINSPFYSERKWWMRLLKVSRPKQWIRIDICGNQKGQCTVYFNGKQIRNADDFQFIKKEDVHKTT